MARASKHQSPEQRFWRAVAKSGGCWEWTGARTANGYGELMVDGRMMYAHRFSYALANGPVPDGLFVLHRCDNPSCVRPEHLFPGTNADNMRDASSKGRVRGFPKQAVCARGHELTADNRDARGRCVTCKAATARSYSQSQRPWRERTPEQRHAEYLRRKARLSEVNGG